ncbi:MAG TPA: sulfide/dihydroorotate dehydrogenase-like FAD/NAD-binding protein [Planctomycetota bacterium]|nr:sulfide/dihydroorotate dehydrogenase-like FAD/NAD-binding protein [Planctomycetota bacterium]
MFKIVRKEYLNPEVIRIDVEAPLIARKRKAGQFVVLRVFETSERFPLTIVDSDPEAGTITLIYQVVGRSTVELAGLTVGETIQDVLGPLGHPTEVKKVGTVVAVGGGVGIALLYPIAKAMADAGNHVVSILGARNKDLLILAEEMAEISDRTEIITDDGSSGRKGLVTEPLREYIESGGSTDQVVVVGPAIMMKAVVALTKPKAIPTLVSLNPIMVDGTGMCGGCRVSVGGETKFACVDGPEFDGLQVDFDQLMHRQRFYLEEEEHSSHYCKLNPRRKT